MVAKASAKDQATERNAIKLMIELDRLARMHPNQMWSVYHSEAALMIKELLSLLPSEVIRERMMPRPPIVRARLK